MPKKKNNTNLHRESNLRVETNINGVIHDDQTEVNKIFYKMNAQSDYTPEVDMNAIGLAGNQQSRERLTKDKKEAKSAKPVIGSGRAVKDSKIEQAMKDDLSNRGIN